MEFGVIPHTGRVCTLTEILNSLGWLEKGSTDLILLHKMLWFYEAHVAKHLAKKQALSNINRVNTKAWEAPTNLVM